ncbi:MAG: hypothetical protein AB7G23_11640 [Vicinamibacterales bacterium]
MAWVLACVLATVALPVSVGAQGGGRATRERAEPPPDRVREVARLETDVAWLERQLALAKSETFYLVLAPDTPDLRLMFAGATLVRVPVTALEVGTGRQFFSEAAPPAGWRDLAWTKGALVPGRPIEELNLIVPESEPERATEGAETGDAAGDAAGSAEAETAAVADVPEGLPPTAEEAIEVPARYLVRFEGGLALEIVQAPDASASLWERLTTRLRMRLEDVVSVLRASSRDSVRLRLTMAAEDASALYRSLPPEPSLLIEPPQPAVP